MNLVDPIKISYRNLMAAKFRSFLTILGIIIGVASVILIMSIGNSAQFLILDQVQSVGSNLIGVMPGASDEKGEPPSAMGIVIDTLTYDDLEAIRDKNNVPEIEDAAGFVQGVETASYAGNEKSLTYIGTTASYINVLNSEIDLGRFFTKDEEADLSKVAVLGSKAKEDLFGNDDPLNKKVKIDKQTFTVIGVMKNKGGGVGSFQDDAIFLPLVTAQKLLSGIDYLVMIRAKAASANDVDQSIADIKALLHDRHNIKKDQVDDFTIVSQASGIEMITKITNILRYFILAIGSLSLLVGGVGIMNIMLIAASQRIREIGTRKAVGAKNKDILLQFLVESSTVSLIGGVIGIIGGIIVSYLVAIVAQALGYNWPLLISVSSIFLAVGISILIGMIFGVFPARKASRISPMEALRYE
jgi:putative ABC transport system permease protein